MWKKTISSAVITLALFLGLNLYISTSLSTIIKEEAQKAVEKADPDITLQMGSVESSPFRGNIDLIDVYYHHSSTQGTVKLERFSLDLSYLDFLRLYFFDLQRGMSEITSLDFTAEGLQLGDMGSFSNLTTGSIRCSYSGSLWQLLHLAANKKLPVGSPKLTLNTRNIRLHPTQFDTTDNPITIDQGALEANYQGNFKLVTLKNFELSGPELTTRSDGRITFDTRSRAIHDITDVQLDISLEYQSQNEIPLTIATDYGTISFESLDWSSQISTVENSTFDLKSWKSWGEKSTIEARNISLGLSGNGQSTTSMVLQTLLGSSTAISLQQFRLKTESDSETLEVQSLLIDHQAFDINAEGHIQKRPSPAQSEFGDFRVTLTEMQPDFRNLMGNISQMLGVQFSSGSESLSITLKGRLGKPGISK